MNVILPKNSEGKPEWFAFNDHALQMYRLLIDLAHTWDDLIDKDKDVSERDINRAFLTCLFQLQMNPVYRQIQDAILPMWLTVVTAYEAANQWEKTGDPHGLEIGHTLRYAAGHVIAFAMVHCAGFTKASEHMGDMWKAVCAERIAPYIQENAA